MPPRRSSDAGSRATEPVTLRELMRDRAFVLYLVGQTLSGAGSALSSVALVFAVLAISGSAGSVGLVLLASRLPGIALTLTGGILADHWSRKWIAVSADGACAVLQLATAGLLLAGRATVLELTALQCAAGAAGALFTPAAGALLAGVAPRGQIRRASSLLGITTAIAQTGGLAVSGIIVALAGPGTSLVIDGASYAVSAITLACIPAVGIVGTRGRSALAELREGWHVVSQHRWLVVTTLREAIVNVLVLSPFFVLGPVIARDRLGGAPAWSAIVLAYVIGNLVAAHVTYHWAPRRPVLAALVVSIGLAPLLTLLGLTAPLWLIVPGACLAGAESTVYSTLCTAVLQANLADDVLGRAGAVVSLGSTALVPVGMGLAGAVAGAVGASTVMLAAAVVVLVTAAGCAALPATWVVLSLDRRE